MTQSPGHDFALRPAHQTHNPQTLSFYRTKLPEAGQQSLRWNPRAELVLSRSAKPAQWSEGHLSGPEQAACSTPDCCCSSSLLLLAGLLLISGRTRRWAEETKELKSNQSILLQLGASHKTGQDFITQDLPCPLFLGGRSSLKVTGTCRISGPQAPGAYASNHYRLLTPSSQGELAHQGWGPAEQSAGAALCVQSALFLSTPKSPAQWQVHKEVSPARLC